MTGYAIAPNEQDGFVELSRSSHGRVFRKQILHYGPLLYPTAKGGRVQIDEAFADTLILNFNNKVCDIVQVPKALDNNDHSEDPDRNIGEVINVGKTNDGVYVDIDARDDDAAERIAKKLYLGASAMMHLNYKDTKTGMNVGPTLLHVAVTNRPYVTGLQDFEEIIAASADGISEAVFLTAPTKERKMPLDELLAELKADHGIDVPALQEKAANADAALALSNKIQEELVGTGLLKLSNGEEVTAEVLVGAVAEAGEQITTLSNRVDEMAKASAQAAAEARVDGYVRTGHILPKNRDAQVTLLLSNSALFEDLLPEKPLVKLSNTEGSAEEGTDVPDDDEAKLGEEVARLSAKSVEMSAPYTRKS